MEKTDQELVKKFREGDELAFVILYNRHKRNLVLFCLKMLQNHTIAEDIAQEAFLKVYLKRTKLQSDGNFKSFIFTIARNLCLNQVRNQKNTISIEKEGSLEKMLLFEDKNSAAIEKNDILNQALRQLDANYREVVLLRDYEGFNYQEIAEVTNLSESAVKSKLFKARQKLREILLPILKDGV